ncbi:hypothetical protein [Paracoccus aestuariivivens]|uniref:Uncharacterized protein n=1 Tax=Paracoccus aestuariivivens TaxID=1820333 RepID=A0A6L6JDZ4_9RHOB|nr:hypothetical protein [Paracoccus aestuariivivens]MTH79445.1 hypothetical protein [Paracoccus aestuariivivens]
MIRNDGLEHRGTSSFLVFRLARYSQLACLKRQVGSLLRSIGYVLPKHESEQEIFMKMCGPTVALSENPLRASAKLDAGMVQTLSLMLDDGSQPVTLELRDFGIWAVTEDGVRMFIGSMEKRPDAPDIPRPS